MRRQLISLVVAAMCLLLIALLAPLVVLLIRDAHSRGVLAVTQHAQAVASSPRLLDGATLPDRTQDGIDTSALLVDGRITGVPVEPGLAAQLVRGCRASTVENLDGLDVVVPVISEGRCAGVVRMRASTGALRAGLGPLLIVVFSLAAGLMVIGVLLAERLGAGLLRSVSDLAGAADRVATGDLTARVAPSGPPEIRRIGTELNRLAVRVGHLVAAERRRGADLTHRLRTPLTALRLDVDAVTDPVAAGRLTEGVAAMTAAVDEVILAARRLATEPGSESADLTRVVRERAAFWAPLAEDTGRETGMQVDRGPLPVRAGAAALEAALDALLGNVFAHTPAGARFAVIARAAPHGGATLIVDDAGPGLRDPAVVARGRSGGSSTGLGLDIARRCAEESGGSLGVGRSPMGGARVWLQLGPPAEHRPSAFLTKP